MTDDWGLMTGDYEQAEVVGRYTTRFARTAQIVLAAIVLIVLALTYYVVARRRRARSAVLKL